MTLRDRPEVETLARELGATKALADALRAQTHEAANRLHVIAGLVELGRAEEAIELAGSEAASAPDLLRRLGARARPPRARPGPGLGPGAPPPELPRIVGNLIDTALDALGPDRDGTIS